MRAALYARVSTTDQNSQLQLEQLREYAQRRGLEASEYVDHGVSGAKAKRPALDALMDAVRRREVDLVVATKLDRLGRSVQHLTALAGELEALGVDLAVIDQGLDTTTPTGRLTFHVLAAMAQFERELIRERTLSGVEAARRQGRYPGRPRAMNPEQVRRARWLRASGRSVSQVGLVQAHHACGMGRGVA